MSTNIRLFLKQFFKRIKAIKVNLDNVPEETIIISTTGKTSRELYEIRSKHNIASIILIS